MIALRPYQLEAVEKIHQTFKGYFRQYIEMPTGSGKTVTFFYYAKKYHNRILIIVPSKQLLNQVYETALKFYEPFEISRKGDRFDEFPNKVHICIINSIRGDYLESLIHQKFDLTIIDEAHHTQSESYKRFIRKRSDIFHERDMLILGVTATPDRIDGKLLDEILVKCSFKLNIETLIEQGHLSDIEGYSVKTNIDISDVDDHNGDFSLKNLYSKINTDDRNNMIKDIIKNDMKDRKSIIFCVNVDHSKKINKLLNDNGICSIHIDGKKTQIERESLLSSFRNDEVSVICNCQLLTEGFDEPSIDGVILARPTKSKALFSQMIGRGLRKFPGKKNCKIIDIVDNHKNLSGFNSLLVDEDYPEMQSFSSIRDIRNHISKEIIKISEFVIEKVNFFDTIRIQDFEALPCMIDYLQDNNIYFQHPITIDEASFLIWHHKLKLEYQNGKH
jgi:superfamily II DNA or RNA helicase